LSHLQQHTNSYSSKKDDDPHHPKNFNVYSLPFTSTGKAAPCSCHVSFFHIGSMGVGSIGISMGLVQLVHEGMHEYC